MANAIELLKILASVSAKRDRIDREEAIAKYLRDLNWQIECEWIRYSADVRNHGYDPGTLEDFRARRLAELARWSPDNPILAAAAAEHGAHP